MFIDEIKVHGRAGHGGKGAIAFHREAYVAKGGPSGGNGGRGGDVILEGDRDINNLIGLYYQPKLRAQDGNPGMGKGMDGHAGKDLVVKVPCGTLAWKTGVTAEAETPASHTGKPVMALSSASRPVLRMAGRERAFEVDLEEPAPVGTSIAHAKGELLADITEHGQQFVLCKGGRGGLGNRNFATARRQTPRFAQPGEAGDEGDFLIELRIMAEVGLVGYPNAGKSTLLTAISRARPKIAPYPFTTLHPQIGIVEYKDFCRLTVCDVPGLIEGAHKNVGLGHAFLRHIQRCKVLVVLLDMAGMDAREPWEDYKHVLEELELYDPSLVERPRLVVGNKMDEPPAEQNLKQFKRKIRKTPVLAISAGLDEGVDDFKQQIRKAVAAATT